MVGTGLGERGCWEGSEKARDCDCGLGGCGEQGARVGSEQDFLGGGKVRRALACVSSSTKKLCYNAGGRRGGVFNCERVPPERPWLNMARNIRDLISTWFHTAGRLRNRHPLVRIQSCLLELLTVLFF